MSSSNGPDNAPQLFAVMFRYDIFYCEGVGIATIEQYIAWLRKLSPAQIEQFRQEASAEFGYRLDYPCSCRDENDNNLYATPCESCNFDFHVEANVIAAAQQMLQVSEN